MIKKKILRDVLWDCYVYLQNLYGTEPDDILTGEYNVVHIFGEDEKQGKKLKRKIRDIFRKK